MDFCFRLRPQQSQVAASAAENGSVANPVGIGRKAADASDGIFVEDGEKLIPLAIQMRLRKTRLRILELNSHWSR